MSGHITLERIHDLVDGLVPASEEVRLRHHLESCSDCRGHFESIEATVRALGSLPDAARPPEAIWRAIEGRMDAGDAMDASSAPEPSEGARVVPLRVAARGPRRLSLTVSQLAAAAALVSLLSAAVVWKALGGGAVPGATTVATATEEGPSARVVALGETGYDEAVVQLETIVEQGRDVLSPETLATLEASLHTIDEAIAEVRTALESDPSSELLARLLANHQRSKLRVLRQAAASVQPRS